MVPELGTVSHIMHLRWIKSICGEGAMAVLITPPRLGPHFSQPRDVSESPLSSQSCFLMLRNRERLQPSSQYIEQVSGGTDS